MSYENDDNNNIYLSWFFTVESEQYGCEEFGPYDTEDDAISGLSRVRTKASSRQ